MNELVPRTLSSEDNRPTADERLELAWANLKAFPQTTVTKMNEWAGAMLPRLVELECQHNERRVSIHFANKASGEAFSRFVNIYVSDHAPGNSYSGYFPSWWSPIPRPILVGGSSHRIDQEVVKAMTARICGSRLMTPDGEGLPDSLSLAELFPVIQQRSGIYSVSFDELKLPPRQIPTKFGEFVRVVDDPDYRRIDCYFLAEQGSKACLAIPNADLHEVPRFAKVPMKNVMKIFPRYHSHENHSHQSLLMEAAELLQKGVFLLEAGDSASLSH